MASNAKHPALGAMPKAKGGSNRKLDHPSTGTMPKGINNTRGMRATAPAGGKAHKSSGGKERRGSYPSAPIFPEKTATRKPADKW